MQPTPKKQAIDESPQSSPEQSNRKPLNDNADYGEFIDEVWIYFVCLLFNIFAISLNFNNSIIYFWILFIPFCFWY